MQKLRAEPFLWIHAGGIVVFPIWMALVLMGLATGEPILPVWMEQLIVLSIGTALVARMQIQRPFYLFSILVVSLPPEQLSEDRRRILSAFQSWNYRLVPALVILVMVLLGEWLYDIAPLFHSLSVLPDIRLLGLGVAVLGFWVANLFIQIPAAAAWVLSSDEQQLERFDPVDVDVVESQFTRVGKPWSNLLRRWDPALLTDVPSPDNQQEESELEPADEVALAEEMQSTSEATAEEFVEKLDPEQSSTDSDWVSSASEPENDIEPSSTSTDSSEANASLHSETNPEIAPKHDPLDRLTDEGTDRSQESDEDTHS